MYKKGKSRSKRFSEPAAGDTATPTKRPKITQDVRLQRIAELREIIKDVSDQILYKEKRREKASNVHNYKECDMLTEQISALKGECREHKRELAELERKQKKSLSYQKRRELSSQASSSYPSSGSAMSPISIMSSSSTPLTSPSPQPLLAVAPQSPSSRLSSRSPLQSPVSSDSEFSIMSPPSVAQTQRYPRSPSCVGTTSGDEEHSGSTVLLNTDEDLMNTSAADQTFGDQHFQ